MRNPIRRSRLFRFSKQKHGFALIATLSVTALITLLVLALLSLSTQARRTNSQWRNATMAQANARLSLMLAMAELQKQMGPDTRISAPADAGTLSTGGQPRWTAIYDAWRRPATTGTAENPATRNPVFRGWLASGANSSRGGPPGNGSQTLLVSSSSVGAGARPEDEVRVPALAYTAGRERGQLAWWTSDESIKAKINAGAAADSSTSPTSPISRAQSPPYTGTKAIPALSAFEWRTNQRGMSVTTGEVNLAAGLGSAGLGRVSHNITLYSAGVLSDVRGGHLKRDLSNLLSRPIAELVNKPLYLQDGRINYFQINSTTGVVTNNTWVPNFNLSQAPPPWGINLEELHLFHEIHREVDWSGNKPRLVNKGNPTDVLNDRFFIYRKPILESVSQVLSFVATPEAGTNPVTYKLEGMLNPIVVLSNPNDIQVVWQSGLPFRVETEGFPYRPKWNIARPGRTPALATLTHTVDEINSAFFRSVINGGFTLEAGEAAVFGASSSDTQAKQVNLTRGFRLGRGVLIDDGDWDSDNNVGPYDGLRATRLRLTDKLDLTMVQNDEGLGATPSGWIQNHVKIDSTAVGFHRYGGGGGSRFSDGPGSLYMPASIRPSQTPEIRNFTDLNNPKPVLMVTSMTNVERSRTALLPPNALPSRPYILQEPGSSRLTAISNNAVTNLLPTMQNAQLVTIAEPMDFTPGNDRTMPAGAGGLNIYHGGAREVALGGNLNVIKRRIPLSAPLSLGAFENAIASGFHSPFRSQNTRTGAYNVVSPMLHGTPEVLPTSPAKRTLGTGPEPDASKVTMSRSIGNSWTNPFLSSDRIQDGTYHDQSWLANTALWDSWFLSGIVRPGPSGAWNSDSRSQRQQFRELAERTATLRNARIVFHPQKSLDQALNELFNGDNLKPEAIDRLTKYLLVDGAFNVNSTSEAAWKAFLTSVRDHELIDANGSISKKTHPFGTLGYAVNAATSGNEGDWAGFRDLSDTELDALAKAIVVEVKARGPFLSMADFVNRRPNSTDPVQRALGALQVAIDKSGLNNRFNSPGRSLAPADVPMFAGRDTLSSEPVPARAVGAAGYLSQGALLTAFGSQVTVRGDTFVIRTYGDTRDPSDRIQARAWCEAVVQRLPDFVDSTNPAEASAGLSAANNTFGRKFSIVSFRWLSPDEI